MVQKEHESPGSLSGMDTESLQDYPRFPETESNLRQSLSGINVGFCSRVERWNKC